MKINGIFLPHLKSSENDFTESAIIPEKVILPLVQHMGTECVASVKVGDIVKVGQVIAEADAFMSVPVHASVSGKVSAISDLLMSNGRVCKAITIESDGEQTMSEDITPPIITDKASLVRAVKSSGSCGQGGAGFPTHVKLGYDENKTKIDTLVINAAECEPYITSDYRDIMESPEDVIDGICVLLKTLNINKAYIGIENNKPKAIKLLSEMTKDDERIEVVGLRATYPQGAEKVIIYKTLGRVIEEGELTSAKGAIVLNVSTVSFLSRYFKTGIPFIKRRITIDGGAVKSPKNIWAYLGTPASVLLDKLNVDKESIKKLLFGGPMMGSAVSDLDTPIIKTTNAILAFDNIKTEKKTACIKCSRCIESCPVSLMPTVIEKAYDFKNIEALDSYKTMLCINCGTCSYVCPAKRSLAEKIQLSKTLLQNRKQWL